MNLKLRRKSLADHFEDFLSEMAATHHSVNTLRSYRTVLQSWIASGLEPRAWVLEQSAHLKASSANQRRAVLNAYLNWCVLQGYLDTNQLARTRPARTPERLNRVLTVEETARLIESCAHLGKQRVRGEHTQNLGHLPIEAYRARLGAMVAVEVTAGLRVAELCRIQLAHLDLDKRTLRVVGKGDKERAVRLGKAAKRKLAEWMEYRTNLELPGGYLFCTDHGVPVSPRVYARQLVEACWWADIKPPINPHTLRHTFATHAISSGIPVVDVKDMLGHGQLATTMLYIHRNPDKGWDRYDAQHPLSGENQDDA